MRLLVGHVWGIKTSEGDTLQRRMLITGKRKSRASHIGIAGTLSQVILSHEEVQLVAFNGLIYQRKVELLAGELPLSDEYIC